MAADDLVTLGARISAAMACYRVSLHIPDLGLYLFARSLLIEEHWVTWNDLHDEIKIMHNAAFVLPVPTEQPFSLLN